MNILHKRPGAHPGRFQDIRPGPAHQLLPHALHLKACLTPARCLPATLRPGCKPRSASASWRSAREGSGLSSHTGPMSDRTHAFSHGDTSPSNHNPGNGTGTGQRPAGAAQRGQEEGEVPGSKRVGDQPGRHHAVDDREERVDDQPLMIPEDLHRHHEARGPRHVMIGIEQGRSRMVVHSWTHCLTLGTEARDLTVRPAFLNCYTILMGCPCVVGAEALRVERPTTCGTPNAALASRG